MPPASTHELWFTTLRAAGRRPRTLENYSFVLTGFITWRNDDDLTNVERMEALRYAHWLQERYKPAGVSNRLRALRNFYGWCIREELMVTNPFRDITIRIPEEVRSTPDEESIDKLLQKCKPHKRDCALITLLADTGARKHEIAALQMEHLDLRSGVVHFPVSKSRARVVPLTDRAVTNLARWLRQRGVGSGSLWSVTDPYSLVKAALRRHSGGSITPHSLRRAFAVRWLTQGGSEVSLMRLCGWSSREMINLYSRASADVIAADEFRRLMV